MHLLYHTSGSSRTILDWLGTVRHTGNGCGWEMGPELNRGLTWPWIGEHLTVGLSSATAGVYAEADIAMTATQLSTRAAQPRPSLTGRTGRQRC
jgi:hypothetical protein